MSAHEHGVSTSNEEPSTAAFAFRIRHGLRRAPSLSPFARANPRPRRHHGLRLFHPRDNSIRDIAIYRLGARS
ncbi:hypothetical protein C7S16_5279 [Burkholderia thailandensis]|uniref:Uncharacterized protein n=1 Tax=Burkholderia thailandensis TaxID=57975 RepID=A0AAW9CNS3_BURTH|nr:hypothetical protein [Burkholderia thailandensis]MDW9252269.1 hypothetical protein [Burkholderia thailandensis]